MDKFFAKIFRINKPEITVQNNTSVWPSAIGAFLGAFFAFIFGLVAFYVQRKIERYWKHRNSIVEIEQLLNDHLNNSSANQFLLKGAIETLNKHHMAYTLLNQFRIPDDIELKIGNLELLNKYSEYKEPVIKLNHGMTTWQGLNEQLQKNIIANPDIPPPIVHKNMWHISKQGKELNKFLLGLDKDTKRFLAFIRIFMRIDKYIWSIPILKIKHKNITIISKSEVDQELKTLNKEINNITKESKRRISKIMKS